jgi:hypothetical protein
VTFGLHLGVIDFDYTIGPLETELTFALDMGNSLCDLVPDLIDQEIGIPA